MLLRIAQFITYALFISESIHVRILDHSQPQITETMESEATGKRDCCIIIVITVITGELWGFQELKKRKALSKCLSLPSLSLWWESVGRAGAHGLFSEGKGSASFPDGGPRARLDEGAEVACEIPS